MSHTWIATADLQWKSNLAIQLSFILCRLSRHSRPGSSADIGALLIRRKKTTGIHSRLKGSDGDRTQEEREIRHQFYIGRGYRCLLCLFYPARTQCPPWPATWAALLFCHLS